MKLKQRKKYIANGSRKILKQMIQINQHLKFDFVGDIKLQEETNKEMSDRQRQECFCTPPNM